MTDYAVCYSPPGRSAIAADKGSIILHTFAAEDIVEVGTFEGIEIKARRQKTVMQKSQLWSWMVGDGRCRRLR